MPSFVTGDAYLDLPRDPQHWIIKDLIIDGGLTIAYGRAKSGKSFGALGMAIAITTGQSKWLKFAVLKHGPVAYYQIDTPRSMWSEDMGNVTDAGFDVSGIHFCDSLIGPFPFNILEAQHVKWLKEELAAIKPIVVVVDTLREAHGGDENDATTMRNVINGLVVACRPAAILIVAHSRKTTDYVRAGGEEGMDGIRGSSYVSGKMDTIVHFTRTFLNYEGRGQGKGRIGIEQDHDSGGLLILNKKEEEYCSLLNNEVKKFLAEDPNISVNKMATAIAKLTEHKAHRKITEDINTLLVSTRGHKKRKKQTQAANEELASGSLQKDPLEICKLDTGA